MSSSAPHRELRVTSPSMHGDDVKEFQRSLDYLATHRRLEPVEYDGRFGPKTYELAIDIAWLIGLNDRHIKGPISVYVQKRVRHPDDRDQEELDRANTRWRAWKKRGTIPERAYRVARSLVGVMEHGGNNMGTEVSRFIRENGGVGPEPWCGDFVAYCYRHGGSRRVTRSWASVRLLRGLLGITATRHPRRGDLVRYVFDHVGLFVKDNGDGTITTIEGNTGASGAVSDSTTGGDGVYMKRRSKSEVRDYLHVVG